MSGLGSSSSVIFLAMAAFYGHSLWFDETGETPTLEVNKIHGVNYANKFIPEDGMAGDFFTGEFLGTLSWEEISPWGATCYVWNKHTSGELDTSYEEGTRKYVCKCKTNFFFVKQDCVPRVTLADVVDTQHVTANSRMLEWLNRTIKANDFTTMQENGVNVIRVPSGYWNWITYPGNTTPTGQPKLNDYPLQEKYLNLQRLATPSQYKQYFDRIFEFADARNISVLLVLEALPGVASGNVADVGKNGIATEPWREGACKLTNDNCLTTYFEKNTTNHDKAIEAVSAMAIYGKNKTNLYGIEVIIKNNKFPSEQLHTYYKSAILAARRAGLPKEKPVVVFEHYQNLQQHVKKYDDYETFGKVLFDTHIYTDFETAVKTVNAVEDRLFVGEWSLGLKYRISERERPWSPYEVDEMKKENGRLKADVEYLVAEFQKKALGTFFWNFDHPLAEWSFSKLSKKKLVNWTEVFSKHA